jgi:hypothetical protein
MATSNPFAAPNTDTSLAPVSTDHDRYIESVVSGMLEPGERLRWTAYMIKAPPLWAQILFMGLIMLLLFKYFLVAVTNRRVILIRTKNFWMKPKMMNLGTEEIRWDNVKALKVGGVANNRSIDFQFNDGTKRTLRIAPWAKFVSGQQEFFKFAQSFDRSQL